MILQGKFTQKRCYKKGGEFRNQENIRHCQRYGLGEASTLKGSLLLSLKGKNFNGGCERRGSRLPGGGCVRGYIHESSVGVGPYRPTHW